MRLPLLAAAALLASVAAAQDADFRLSGQPRQGALLRGTAPPGTVALDINGRPVPLAPGGRFILGLDRDAGPTATLTARLADGSEVRLPLGVAPRAWAIQHVNMARPAGGPTPEYARLREAELVRIGAARAGRNDATGWSQPLIWPARGRISGVFGSQRVYRGGVPAAYHSGVDIAAGAGAPVVAPADGVVTLAPPPRFSLEGNLVILDHGMGLTSAFLHLSRASVGVGDRVRQGQEIGRVGATGRATGPHLHWSLVWNGARLDPQAAAGAR
ncbi:MAG TPA: M23 family metallopeptidase [Allosphingosinicella sp.]|nr:M23 family metallopeptidase [Allosphingosinicella sp.]